MAIVFLSGAALTFALMLALEWGVYCKQGERVRIQWRWWQEFNEQQRQCAQQRLEHQLLYQEVTRQLAAGLSSKFNEALDSLPTYEEPYTPATIALPAPITNPRIKAIQAAHRGTRHASTHDDMPDWLRPAYTAACQQQLFYQQIRDAQQQQQNQQPQKRSA